MPATNATPTPTQIKITGRLKLGEASGTETVLSCEELGANRTGAKVGLKLGELDGIIEGEKLGLMVGNEGSAVGGNVGGVIVGSEVGTGVLPPGIGSCTVDR